jgi:beta-galactosidase
VPVPDATDSVEFTVSGPARIVATDNGGNTNHEPFLLPQHHLYGGRMIAILQATASSGSIRVHASAAGLADGDAQLTVVPGMPSEVMRSF